MRLFKTSFRNRKGRIQTAGKWYGEFQDHHERTRRMPLFTDRAASDECLRGIGKLVAYHRSSGGQTDPALLQWIENLPSRIKTRLLEIGLLDARRVASAKTLNEHVGDYRAALLAKGDCAEHVSKTCNAIQRIMQACGFTFWTDIQASGIGTYLAGLRGENGIAARTFNRQLQACKSFSSWMVKERRASENPLHHLSGLNIRTDQRRIRRALSTADMQKLLDAARTGPERYGIDGPQRALIYELAATTGLRVSELASLTVGSFSLGESPSVEIQAAYSKNRRQDRLPLRADMVGLLREFLAAKLPGTKVFPKLGSEHSADMLKDDLQAAGIAYVDDSGRVFDFHSLRHQFISGLAAAGVHPKTAQQLARHSTITLTMDKYSHVLQAELDKAVDLLPGYSTTPEQQRATGTIGKNVLASCLALQGGKQGYSGTPSRQTIASAQGQENPHQMHETLVYQGIPRGGDRTHDQGIMSPRL